VAKEWLAPGGFDPLYGACPLRQLVQTAIGDDLASQLLAGEIVDSGGAGALTRRVTAVARSVATATSSR
jgi:ATP-dependent Clp protease ATP-binding subunit ClpA